MPEQAIPRFPCDENKSRWQWQDVSIHGHDIRAPEYIFEQMFKFIDGSDNEDEEQEKYSPPIKKERSCSCGVY